MKLKALRPFLVDDYRVLNQEEEFSVSDLRAKELILRGLAEEVKDKPAKKGKSDDNA